VLEFAEGCAGVCMCMCMYVFVCHASKLIWCIVDFLAFSRQILIDILL